MVRIIKITNERAQMGKETSVRIRGLEVDATKLRKFRQRKGFTDKDLTAGASTGSATPSDISCFTPKLDPIDATTTEAQEASNRTASAALTAGNIITDSFEETDMALQNAWSQQYFHELALGDGQGGTLDTVLPGEVPPSSLPVCGRCFWTYHCLS